MGLCTLTPAVAPGSRPFKVVCNGWRVGKPGCHCRRDRQRCRLSIAGIVRMMSGGRQQADSPSALLRRGTYSRPTRRQMASHKTEVFAVHQGRDGTVWSGTSMEAKQAEERHSQITRRQMASGEHNIAIGEGPDETMWFGTRKVSVPCRKRLANLFTNDGYPPKRLTASCRIHENLVDRNCRSLAYISDDVCMHSQCT